ncbi:MAG TPA: AAA family ATPase [Gemmatales bacterium]|nr:AAA family ATPase [Gemmatales bacterium]HMP57833.1 AAA family ATPase [Gemmatales bacterium]
MYPLSVVLVGCSDELLAQLQPELAAVDAHVEVGFIGVESAIEGLRVRAIGDQAQATMTRQAMAGARDGTGDGHGGGASPESRHLFIVALDSPPDLAQLRRLSGAFVGQPIIAILDAEENPALPIAAMRAGASQVVLTPVNPDDFRQALNCISLQAGFGAQHGTVIAIAGVTGGCGATTIAINLAYELAHLRRLRVILTELSLQVGKLPVYLDLTPAFTIHDLLRETRRLDVYQVQGALTPVAERLSVLTGPYESVTPLAVSPADVFTLTDFLQQICDVVVLDVPCTYDSLYFETLAAADRVVLVAEQKVPSIRSMQIISNNLLHKKPFLLLNRYDANVKGFGVTRLKELLQVSDLLTIQNDYEAVSNAINHGKPLRQEAPRSRVLQDLDALAQRLLPVDAGRAAAAEGTTMMGGLMRALGLK